MRWEETFPVHKNLGGEKLMKTPMVHFIKKHPIMEPSNMPDLWGKKLDFAETKLK